VEPGKIIKITEDSDPDRCQAVTSNGQCRNKKYDENTNYCLAHGGNRGEDTAKKISKKNYYRSRWQARLEQYTDNDNIKSLREEIGILRLILEETLNKCNDESELIIQSNKISDLVMKVDKVVTSCHKLEGSMGHLLDKQAILQFASEIITVISEEIEDKEILNRIADKIVKRVSDDS